MSARSVPTMEGLFPLIGKLLSNFQDGTTNSRTTQVKLFNLQRLASDHKRPSTTRQGTTLVGLGRFLHAFGHHVLRILSTKRNDTGGNNVVKFLGEYTKHVKQNAPTEEEACEGFGDWLVELIIEGKDAKDETVRFRVVHIFAEVAPYLVELDEEWYRSLRSALLERMKDKKSFIRVQAVRGFAQLTRNEQDPSEDITVPNGQLSRVKALRDVLKYDPAAEVRREALTTFPHEISSIRDICGRTRDVNPPVRKAVYSSVLEPNVSLADGPGPFHPSHLELSSRETVVSNGLQDPDEATRIAASKLVCKWFEDLSYGAKSENLMEKVVLFLGLFDVAKEPAELALKCIFDNRRTVFTDLVLDDEYWSSFIQERSSEKGMLARVFVDYCLDNKKEANRLEDNTPPLIKLADIIKSVWAQLANNISKPPGDLDSRPIWQNQLNEAQFILGELLKVASRLDHTDEIGRRSMWTALRDILPDPALPYYLVDPCCEALRAATSDEPTLLRVIMEVAERLKVSKEEEEEALLGENTGESQDYFGRRNQPRPSTGQQSPQRQKKHQETDLQSIRITNGILKTMTREIDKNQRIDEVVKTFAVPAINDPKKELRMEGYLCLGLCCLISPTLAALRLNDLNRVACNAGWKAKFRVPILKVFFDILVVHGDVLLKAGNNEQLIADSFLELLHDQDLDVCAITAQGLSKLVNAGQLRDNQVLKGLVISYVSPSNKENQSLRKALSIFFAAFSTTSSRNQRRLYHVFVECYNAVSKMRGDWDDDEIISRSQFVSMFVEWTDPKNINQTKTPHGVAEIDDTVQFDLATAVLRELYRDDMSKEDKKALCQMLHLLEIPIDIDDLRLRKHWILMTHLPQRRPLPDERIKQNFNSYMTTVNTRFEDKLEPLNDENLRKLDELSEEYAVVDNIKQEPDDGDTSESARRSKRAREDSLFSSDATRSNTPAQLPGKRRRTVQDDDASFVVKRENSQAPHPPPRKQPPRTAATPQVTGEVIVISSDSDDDGPITPVARRPAPRPIRRRPIIPPAPPTPPSDDEAGELPQDSIMDSDSEEEIQVEDVLLVRSDE